MNFLTLKFSTIVLLTDIFIAKTVRTKGYFYKTWSATVPHRVLVCVILRLFISYGFLCTSLGVVLKLSNATGGRVRYSRYAHILITLCDVIFGLGEEGGVWKIPIFSLRNLWTTPSPRHLSFFEFYKRSFVIYNRQMLIRKLVYSDVCGDNPFTPINGEYIMLVMTKMYAIF